MASGNVTVNTNQAQQALKNLERTFERLGRTSSKNLRPLGEGLSAATANASEFEKSLTAANARVIAFGASAGLIVKMQQAFGALVQSTIEVEKSLKDINVILGATDKGLRQFSAGMFKIAKDTGQAFETVAAAATELSRQGLSAEKTLQRTKDAMILARLAGMDAVGAVEALTATLNTFNQSGLDSTKVVNKLAKVDAAFAVSSQDLAQALQRVGASAKGANVSFDELLAIVTAAQQKTARGGAVIGNSFKTIFTRIQRPEVLNQLEALGVAVRDVQGNTLPAIKVLSGLAKTYDSLSSAQKSVVSEQVAGVFQINILKAALGDLNSEYGIYQGALRAASSATNEAIQRNAELNTTTAALLNQTKNSFKEFASSVGEVALAPTMKKLLGQLNSVLEAGTIDKDAEGMGAKVGQAFVGGLGKFIGGPGLIMAGVVTAKLFASFAKFAKEAYVAFTGQNTAAQQRASIQQNILNLLQQEPSILQQVKSGQMTVNQVAQAYLNTLRQQNQLQAQNVNLARQAAAVTYGAGARVRGGRTTTSAASNPSFALATTPVRAGGDGMIPNFASNKTFVATGLDGRLGVLAGKGSRSGQYEAESTNKKIPPLLSKRLVAGGFTHVKIPNVQERSLFPDDVKSEKDLSSLMTNPLKDGIADIAYAMSNTLFNGDDLGIAKNLINNRRNLIKLPPGAQGDIQEAAARLFLGTGENPYTNLNPNAIFDFEDKGPPNAMFRKFFNFPTGLVKADSKRSLGRETELSIISKAFNDENTQSAFSGLPQVAEKTKTKRRARLKRGFRYGPGGEVEKIPGYAKALMPNFSALGAAIAREKAAGIPSSAIRVGRSSQLVSSSNPNGLAVYNTIDEPRGLSQGINRYKSAGLNPKMAGTPNFATMTQLGFSSGYIGKAGGGTLSNAERKAFVDAQRNLTRQYVKSNMTQAQLETETKKLAAQHKLSKNAEGKYVSAMNAHAKNLKQRATSMNSVSGRAGRMFGKIGGMSGGMGSLGATMGLSMLAGSAEQFIPGTAGKGVAGFAGGAATGASLGMMFGPLGAGIGAAVGGLYGLAKAIDPAKIAAEKMTTAFNKATEEFNKEKEVNLRALQIIQDLSSGNLSDKDASRLSTELESLKPSVKPDVLRVIQDSKTAEEAISKMTDVIYNQQQAFDKGKAISEAVNVADVAKILAMKNPELFRELGGYIKMSGGSMGAQFSKLDLMQYGEILKHEIGKDQYNRLFDVTDEKLGGKKELSRIQDFIRAIESAFSITGTGLSRYYKPQEKKSLADDTRTYPFLRRKISFLDDNIRSLSLESQKISLGQSLVGARAQSRMSVNQAKGLSESEMINIAAADNMVAQANLRNANRNQNTLISSQLRKLILSQKGDVGGLGIQAALGADPKSLLANISSIKDKEIRDKLENEIKDAIDKQELNNLALDNQISLMNLDIETRKKILPIVQNRIEAERQYNDDIRELGLRQQEAISALEARIAADREIADFTRNLAIQRASIGKGPAEIARMEAAGKLSNIQSEIFGARQSYNKKISGEGGINAQLKKIDTKSLFGEEAISTSDARLELAVFDRSKNRGEPIKRELEKLDQLLAKEDELKSQSDQQIESLNQRKRIIEETSALEIENIQRQISLRGTLQDIMSEYAMSNEAIQKELSDNMKEVARGMKSDFKGAFKSFIDGSKSAKEAFRSFALSVMDRLMDMAVSYSTNLLFSNIGKGVGLMGFSGGGKVPTKRARGGMISGGSGVRDDVPAMLMGGEYVVKKSAVDALGVGFMNRINSYAEGGVVADNKFIMGTEGDPTNYGKRGKFSVGSRLSAMAITSEDNPQNARRDAMAAEDEQRIQRFRDYEERNRQAMAEFKRANRQKLIGAVMNAAFMIGMDKFGQFLDQKSTGLDSSTFKAAKGQGFSASEMKMYTDSGVGFNSSGIPDMAQGGSAISSLIRPIKPINRAYGGGTGTSMSPSMPMANTSTGVGGGSGAFAMLASSIQQLSASIQSNGGSTGGGGETTVNLTFNIDKSGKAEAKDGENKQGMDSKKKSTEDEKQERQLGDMMKVVVLQTLNEQKRPGGILYQS